MRVFRAAAFLMFVTACSAAPGFAEPPDVAGPPTPPTLLKDVTVEQRPGAVAVTLVTTGPAKYEAAVLDSPVRLVIDLNGTFASPRSRWSPLPEPIKEVRGSQLKPGTARLVIELHRKASYRIEPGPTGLAVVLDASVGAPA